MTDERSVRKALRNIRERHIGQNEELQTAKYVVRLAPTFRKAWFRASCGGNITAATWLLHQNIELNQCDIFQTYWNARRREYFGFIEWLRRTFPIELRHKRFQY